MGDGIDPLTRTVLGVLTLLVLASALFFPLRGRQAADEQEHDDAP